MMAAPSIVLIVDDNPMGRETLEDLLYGQGYTLAFAADGPEALQQAAALKPDVILLDVMMPGMDGFEVCRHLRADPHLAEVPVVMVTALDDSESRLRGLDAGADDFISKPFKRAELRARIKTITRLNRYRSLLEERAALQRAHAELIASYDATIEGWVHALDLRDKETEGHSLRVTEMTVRMARAAGIIEPELTAIRRGALLHDIGKLGIPDAILLKPGPLTAEEWVIMHQHPQYAYDMLAPIAYLQPSLAIPYSHHEKWDGTGYPCGLAGSAIPLAARLFAVVDVWDALRSDRPYRRGWSEAEVLDYLRSQAGTHFDPWAVELFFQVLEAMPGK